MREAAQIAAERRGIAFALGALLLILGAGGCGGSGGDSSSVSATVAEISRAAYLKRADAICAKTEKRQLKAVADFNHQGSATHQGQIELVEEAAVPPWRRQIKELEQLPPPAEGAAEADAFIASFKAAVDRGEADPASVFEEGNQVFAQSMALAAKFGFKVCGGP